MRGDGDRRFGEWSADFEPDRHSKLETSEDAPSGSPKKVRLSQFVRIHRRTLVIALVLVVLWPSALAAAWPVADTDLDGLSTSAEEKAGTDPTNGDTDGDGLGDGWEIQHGLDPLDVDTDGDGVSDLRELKHGASPLETDSDGDSIPDAVEGHLDNSDCDGDGFHSIVDPDDDGDRIPDANETEESRCNIDADGDGVIDGLELDMTCVLLPDCDFDGIPDGEEEDLGFDPLNSDSVGMGMADGLVLALNGLNLSRSPDDDQDGIPDDWETNNTVFPWHDFTPTPGQKDLLVEFVKVTTPASRRYDNVLDFHSAYERVEQAIERNGTITVQWVETVIDRSTHDRPFIIPSVDGRYYKEILAETSFGLNPYVTTVVMNPEHDQTVVGHAGVAQIRGMLAAVDYGAHMILDFEAYEQEYDYWCDCYYAYTYSLTMSPLIEALIRGARDDLLSSLGFYSSRVSGDVFELGDYSDEWEWDGPWFSTGRIVENGDRTYRHVGTELEMEELSDTILHEIGHTLGLCHLDLPECVENLTANEVIQTHRSTMDPDRPGPTFDFLPSEWENIDRFLACPPHEVLGVFSTRGSDDEIIQAKYAYDIEAMDEFTGRSCGEQIERSGGLEPEMQNASLSTMSTFVREEANKYGWLNSFYAHWLPVIGVLGAIGWAVWRIRSHEIRPQKSR